MGTQVEGASTGSLRGPIAIGLIAALVMTNGFWMVREATTERGVASPLMAAGPLVDGCREARWHHNGRLARRVCDTQADGVYEAIALYTRDGVLLNEGKDTNQDGLIDEATWFDPTGRLALRVYDEDGDGYYERHDELLADGRLAVWFDREPNLHYEERRLYGPDGALIALERDSPEGFRAAE